MPTAAPRTVPSTMTITSYDTQTGYRVRKRLTTREMILAGAILFFVLLSIGLLVGLLIRIYVVDEKHSDDDICKSPECVRAAASILLYEDPSYLPCDDFYSFACDGYIKKMPVGTEVLASKEEEHLHAFRDLLESLHPHNVTNAVSKAVQMYGQCIKYNSNSHTVLLEDTKQLLKQLGGWPVTMAKSDWKDQRDEEFVKFLGDVMRRGFDTELLSVTLMPDLKNSNITRITIDQPNSIARHLSTRHRRQVGINPSSSKDYEDEYRKNVTEMAKALGKKEGDIIDDDINAMLQLHNDLMDIATPSDRRTNYTKIYRALSLWELHRYTNTQNVKFDWKEMLEKLFEGVTVISEDTDVMMLLDMDYLKHFPTIYHKHSKRTLTNYVIYEGILKPLTILFSLQQSPTHEDERWHKCITMTNEAMPHALSRLYIENLDFDIVEAVEEASDIVTKIQDAYKETFEENSWLDAETKEAASDKIGGMKKFIGFPDLIFDDLKLNQYYDYVKIASSPLNTYLTAKNRATIKELEQYRKPTHENRWTVDPKSSYVQYESQSNSIWVPIGILQPPHFDRKYLAAMNYGGIASIISREMERAFDDSGRQFDEKGNLRKWWSDKSQLLYLNQTKCFVSQYNQYCPTTLQVDAPMNKSHLKCLDGVASLDQNLAANVGVRTSFKAYKKWVEEHGTEAKLPGLTEFFPDQVFFVTYAQMMCENYPSSELETASGEDSHFPGKYRVNGALSNLPEFAEKFQCSAGPLNRKEARCTLW